MASPIFGTEAALRSLKIAWCGPGRALVLIWCVFVARGIFYSALLPIWEGYDEPFHFDFVQHLVTSGQLPEPATLVSREVQSSLHLLPLPWTLRLHGYPGPIITHDEFWKLCARQRERLEGEFRHIPKEWSREPATELIRNYEAQQPPLYYLLVALPLRTMWNLDLASRVFWLRVLGVIVTSFLIPLGYLVVKRVFGNQQSALGVLALATMMPELMINISRVANESLAIVIYTFLVYVTLRVVEGPARFNALPLVGILLGLGLLTKAYFLTALPAVFMILGWCLWRWPGQWKRLARQSGLVILIATAVAGPWYWRAHRVLGSWSGLYSDAALRGVSKSELFRQVAHVNWLSAVISVLLSHIWYGAWSFLRVSNAVYMTFATVMLLAAIGSLVFFVKLWKTNMKLYMSQQAESAFTDHIFVLICFYGFFWLGLAYQALTLFISEGASASTGWYMYCLVIPELSLAYCGLQTTLPRRLHPWILPLLTSSFAMLDLYGLHFLLVPYYSGIISHTALYKGVFSHSAFSLVPPARTKQLVQAGLSVLADRLAINKPAILTPGVLFVLWLISIAATVWLTASSWRFGGSLRNKLGSGRLH